MEMASARTRVAGVEMERVGRMGNHRQNSRSCGSLGRGVRRSGVAGDTQWEGRGQGLLSVLVFIAVSVSGGAIGAVTDVC